MTSKVEIKGKNVVQLEIEVDAEIFDEGLKKAFKNNAGKFNIPGFRKGKAPQHIVEKFYGEQVLYEDAINLVCPGAFDAAVAEHKLEPVDKPEIDIIEIGKGKNLKFTATITVMPEVELGQYKGVEVKKAVAEVTDEELEKELERIAEENARLITVEDRNIQQGDTAVIDFEGFIDGKAFEGGKGTDYNLVIGSGTFIPGFEDQLVGAGKGDEREVKVTFPEDYGSEELAGKEAVFKVKVKEIKLKELPVLDDEFAKDVSEFDTFEEYKNSIRTKLLEKAEQKAKVQNENNVIQKVVENAAVEIPEAMINKRVDEIVYDFALGLHYQGLDLKRYVQIMGMDMETFRGQFKERAEKEVKGQLVIQKISKVENIAITEDEAKEEFRRLADSYKQPVDEFAKQLKVEDVAYIENRLMAQKTINFLVENAAFV
jgi:trigger factor